MNVTIKQNLDRVVYYGRSVFRIALIISIFGLILSAILTVVFAKAAYETNAVSGIIIWYAIMISMWTLIYSPVILMAVFIYNRYNKTQKQDSLKKEITLFVIAILSAIIFAATVMIFK